MPSITPPKPSLRLVVAVIRSDDVIIKEIGWQTAMSRVIGMALKALPKRWLGQNKRDEDYSERLNTALQDYRIEQMKIGLNPWVWTHKK
ncbi:MAG: hypothetical protein ACXABY_09265 [Candidatus Thorarchaeota archaeon]|jgi:hypothetical protein